MVRDIHQNSTYKCHPIAIPDRLPLSAGRSLLLAGSGCGGGGGDRGHTTAAAVGVGQRVARGRPVAGLLLDGDREAVQVRAQLLQVRHLCATAERTVSETHSPGRAAGEGSP